MNDHDRNNDESARGLLERAWEQSDERNRPKRIERAQWLGQFPNPSGVVSRLESGFLFAEARDCYVFGQFIAAQMLATAYVEHALVDMLADRGLVNLKTEKPPRMNLDEIVKLAAKADLIDSDLEALANKVRRIRNPLTHRRRYDDQDGLTARFAEQGRHPASILEDDARDALRLMFAVFERVLRFDWRSSPFF